VCCLNPIGAEAVFVAVQISVFGWIHNCYRWNLPCFAAKKNEKWPNSISDSSWSDIVRIVYLIIITKYQISFY
jgi:hypothetical protein